MSSFAKRIGCPSSATLSAYHAATLSFLARESVAQHLAACEFCDAESALWLSLSETTRAAEAVTPTAAPPVPLALRLLAESLLSEMHAATQAAERRAA